MLNIEKRINEINENNPTLDDLKYVSIASLYMDLRKKRDFKTMRRLNNLIYYFPSMIERNSFKCITDILDNPELLVRISSRPYSELKAYEKYAVDKTSDEFAHDEQNRNITWGVTFKVKYFFEYFKL